VCGRGFGLDCRKRGLTIALNKWFGKVKVCVGM